MIIGVNRCECEINFGSGFVEVEVVGIKFLGFAKGLKGGDLVFPDDLRITFFFGLDGEGNSGRS